MELKQDINDRIFEGDTPIILHDTHTHTQTKRLHELRRTLEQRNNDKLLLESKNNNTENNNSN